MFAATFHKIQRTSIVQVLYGVPENLLIFGERKNGGNLNEQGEFFVASQF